METVKPSKKISLLALVVLCPALLAFPVGGSCQVQCCNPESAAENPDSFSYDGQGCSLTCCAGVTFIAPSPIMDDSALDADDGLLLTSPTRLWIADDPLYHPPRD